jgi:hypothetical protein
MTPPRRPLWRITQCWARFRAAGCKCKGPVYERRSRPDRACSKVQVIKTNRAEDLPTALVEVTSAAASAIPGAAYTGITLLTSRDGGVATPAASHNYVVLLDEVQKRHREGPCLHAARQDEAVAVKT